MNCLPIQFQSMSLVVNRQLCPFLPVQLSPGKTLKSFLCSLPRSLRPYMLCLSLVSFSPGPSLYHGFMFPLLCRGCLLLCLLHHGGLLFGSGGLLLCLLCRGGFLSGSGGHLLCRGGLLFRLLRCGGLLSGSGGLLLRHGSLLFHLLCRGVQLLRLLCRGGAQFFLFCPFCPGSLLCRLHPGFLLHLDSVTNPVHGHPSICHQRSPRGRSSVTLTLTLHRLLHVTPDYRSHHPLH